ncbi:MAG: hypothetical protein IH957_13595 [Chloroflexi bacterium]|nr:hypothetical protein [Chloroflexota bacterium]
MRIKLNEERTRRVNEAFQAAKQREGAVKDQALLELEEPDERLRRIVQAEGQLAQAQLCHWGLPAQAVIWAYQSIDNAMHAALLADGKSPPQNHQRKVGQFSRAFPNSGKNGMGKRLAQACKLWNNVRFDRTAVSRDTAQDLVHLAYTIYDECSEIVADRMGITASDLSDRLAAIVDKVRLPLVARSEAAVEDSEYYCMSQEDRLESMGLSGMASQVAHGGRDIWLEIVADQRWARDLIEEDPNIAKEIAALYKSFHNIVTALFVKRVAEKFESDPEILNKPDLISASDFNLTCVISYAGLATMDTMLRMMSATSTASAGGAA